MYLTDVTTAFFAENYHAGYPLDRDSDSWNDMNAQERKKLKRAVRMVLMHADSYPLVSENPSQYKEMIQRIATVAEERIRNHFRFENKPISVYKLIDHPEMKKFEKILKLPDNTPEEACKFFRSDGGTNAYKYNSTVQHQV